MKPSVYSGEKWRKVFGKWIYFHIGYPMVLDDAIKFCHGINGTLLEPENNTEIQAIFNFGRALGLFDSFSIGLMFKNEK